MELQQRHEPPIDHSDPAAPVKGLRNAFLIELAGVLVVILVVWVVRVWIWG